MNRFSKEKMIKRILAVTILMFFVGLPITVCTLGVNRTNKIKVTEFLYAPIPVLITEDTTDDKSDIFTQKVNKLLHKQEELITIKDNKEWFIAYKTLIEEYSEWCDPPETIYDYYNEYTENEDELQLLFQVVEAEATSGNFDSKCNVASVIFNRLYHEDFDDSLSKILTKRQFNCISDGRYKKVKVTEDTILACEYAWMIEDTTNGCLYFESGSNNIHSSYADFQFEDSIGHKFYSERN